MLHYQPVVDANGDTIIGAEALIRWIHPIRGMVSPGAFIPLAEGSDLIEHIGRWTLRTACRQIAAWREQGCNVFQGFYFYKPMPATDFEKLFQEDITSLKVVNQA